MVRVANKEQEGGRGWAGVSWRPQLTLLSEQVARSARFSAASGAVRPSPARCPASSASGDPGGDATSAAAAACSGGPEGSPSARSTVATSAAGRPARGAAIQLIHPPHIQFDHPSSNSTTPHPIRPPLTHPHPSNLIHPPHTCCVCAASGRSASVTPSRVR